MLILTSSRIVLLGMPGDAECCHVTDFAQCLSDCWQLVIAGRHLQSAPHHEQQWRVNKQLQPTRTPQPLTVESPMSVLATASDRAAASPDRLVASAPESAVAEPMMAFAIALSTALTPPDLRQALIWGLQLLKIRTSRVLVYGSLVASTLGGLGLLLRVGLGGGALPPPKLPKNWEKSKDCCRWRASATAPAMASMAKTASTEVFMVPGKGGQGGGKQRRISGSSLRWWWHGAAEQRRAERQQWVGW